VNILLIGLVVLAGAATAVQVAMNAELRHHLGHSLLASSVNFGIGFLFLLGLVLVARIQISSQFTFSGPAPWAWVGGVLGALFVAIVAWAARDLGAVLTLTLVIVGQLITSTLLDHYGLMGFQQQPISPTKIAGCGLLLVGAFLIKKG
jgi:transporter family-2 protein